MIILYLKLAFATAVVLAPGWLLARTLGVRSASATLAWSLVAIFGALAVTFALGSTLTLTLMLLVVVVLAALAVRLQRGWRPADTVPGRAWVLFWGAVVGLADLGRRADGSGRRTVPPRPRAEASEPRCPLARPSVGVRGWEPPSRVRLPALAWLHRADCEDRGRGSRARRRAPSVDPRPARRRGRVRGRLGALPPDMGGGRHCRRAGRDDLLRARARWRVRVPVSSGHGCAPAAGAGSARAGVRVGAFAVRSADRIDGCGRLWRWPSSIRRTRSSSGSRSSASSQRALCGRERTCATGRSRSSRLSSPPRSSCSGYARS